VKFWSGSKNTKFAYHHMIFNLYSEYNIYIYTYYVYIYNIYIYIIYIIYLIYIYNIYIYYIILHVVGLVKSCVLYISGFEAHGGVEVTLKKFGHPEGTKMQLVRVSVWHGMDHDSWWIQGVLVAAEWQLVWPKPIHLKTTWHCGFLFENMQCSRLQIDSISFLWLFS
jgi:hypothetical protein